MVIDGNVEDRVVYCKYCGKICVKLVSTTKENPGRAFFACPTPRFIRGHGWMEWVDRVCYVQSAGRFEALEMVLKEKNEQIEELQLENELLLKDLAAEKLKTTCLTKLLKGLIGAFVLVILVNWLYNDSRQSNVYELPDI